MSVGGHQQYAVDFVVRDKTEDFFPLFRKSIPGIFAARLDFGCEWNGRDQDFESCFRFFQRFQSPGLLNGAQHRLAFAVPVVAAIKHDEVNVTRFEIVPTAWLFRSASVTWVDPVLFECVPDFRLPCRLVDERSIVAIVGCEIVIIPNGVNGNRCGQAFPFGTTLPAVVTIVLAE